MRFRFEQRIELPRDLVFEFHQDPGNLRLLHRDVSAFRLIRHDGCIEPGSTTWLETTIARVLPIVMGFEHTMYEPPLRFGERLIHGPFSTFTHIHEFDEVDDKTIVRELLEVTLPICYGGELAMRWFVAPMLKQDFRLRGETLVKLAQSGHLDRPTGGSPT